MDARATTLRSCAKCGQPAVRVFHVTQHYSRGIPAGKTYAHRCGGCNAQFETLSLWKSFFDALAALFILGAGAFIIAASAPPLYYTLRGPAPIAGLWGLGAGTWGGLAGGSFVVLLALLWAASIAWQNASLLRNPPA